MSENRESFVRLDGNDVNATAARATEFLLSEQIIVPNTKRDELWQPSEWAPGPRVRSVLETPSHWQASLANNGVDVTLDRQIYHAMENYEPPCCPACRAPLAAGEHHQMLEAWESEGEPLATCPGCGQSEALGDWHCEWPSVVGAPAISFNNWWPLAATFVDKLRQVLGGRTEFVRAHY